MRSTHLTRRTWLFGILAAPFACAYAVASKTLSPASKAAAPAFTASKPRYTWTWIEWTGWVEHPNGIEIHGEWLGQRSDGMFFRSHVALDFDEVFMRLPAQRAYELMEEKKAKAYLDGFLDCACEVGSPCKRHGRSAA